MSRSKHQSHPTSHSKCDREPDPMRKRKHIPYGSKGMCGYGGEKYYRKYGEVATDVVNKSKERQLSKKFLKDMMYIDDIEDEELTWNEI